jgi:hypothetical protein
MKRIVNLKIDLKEMGLEFMTADGKRTSKTSESTSLKISFHLPLPPDAGKPPVRKYRTLGTVTFLSILKPALLGEA